MSEEDQKHFPTSSKTEFVWYSWSVTRQKWCKSCFGGSTVEAAQKERAIWSAQELDRYHNALVRETTILTEELTEPLKTKP